MINTTGAGSIHCTFCVWIDHIRTLLAIALQSHVNTGVIQSINQSSSDFAAHESAVGMLLSCRCTSQITPEGNYQAINPDIRRMAAAYLRGREKERGIHTAFFHRRHNVSPRVRGPVLSARDGSEHVGVRAPPLIIPALSKQLSRCAPTALVKWMICDVINCMSNK